MSHHPIAPLALLLAAAPAGALDRFEIQVYDAEINAPGRFGLELHLNYTVSGIEEPEWPGAIPPDRLGRITLEPAVGVTEWLELGGYAQLYAGPGGEGGFGGFKLRAKLVLPERVRSELGWPVFLGLNVEVGKVPTSLEQDGWANEFRPIVGFRSRSWLLSVNPIFGYALTGPHRFQAEFEPCAKVAWNTQRGVALGAEYYGGLGPFSGFLPVEQQEHLLFAVLDWAQPEREAEVAPSPWELNLGVGFGLTEATGQHLVVKAIVGRSF